MKNLAQFLQDDTTRCFSAVRLAFLSWTLGALMIWGVGSFQDKKMQEVPDSVITLIGILMTGKVVQKFGEISGSSGATPPPNSQTNGGASSGHPLVISPPNGK